MNSLGFAEWFGIVLFGLVLLFAVYKLISLFVLFYRFRNTSIKSFWNGIVDNWERLDNGVRDVLIECNGSWYQASFYANNAFSPYCEVVISSYRESGNSYDTLNYGFKFLFFLPKRGFVNGFLKSHFSNDQGLILDKKTILKINSEMMKKLQENLDR